MLAGEGEALLEDICGLGEFSLLLEDLAGVEEEGGEGALVVEGKGGFLGALEVLLGLGVETTELEVGVKAMVPWISSGSMASRWACSRAVRMVGLSSSSCS